MELSRRGQIRRLDPVRIERTEKAIQATCRSNDAHVVALAIEAKTQIVVTEDKTLIQDLKNCRIVGRRRRIIKENSASPNKISHVMKLLSGANCN